MKKLLMISAMALAGVSQAQAPQVGQYELLTNQSGLQLNQHPPREGQFSLAAQLGYQYQPELYLAAGFSFASENNSTYYQFTPLVEYMVAETIGLTMATSFNSDGFYWLKGRAFYRQFGEPYRIDYFAEYMYNPNWQDVNVGLASKYYLADNFSLNADSYMQFAFSDSPDSPDVRPIITTGFSFFF